MFLAHLHRQGNSPATVNDRLAVLRLWFRWLKGEGVVQADPADGIGKVRQEKKVLKGLTPAQVRDILGVCQREGRKDTKAAALAARNRAIVRCSTTAGSEPASLWALTWLSWTSSAWPSTSVLHIKRLLACLDHRAALRAEAVTGTQAITTSRAEARRVLSLPGGLLASPACSRCASGRCGRQGTTPAPKDDN